MKKLVCGCLGSIYYATLLKDGTMSTSGRVEMTDDALNAVIQHFLCMPEYKENNGFTGYVYNKKDGGHITLCLFDNDTHEILSTKDEHHKTAEISKEDFESDTKFLTHIIQEICAYAYKNGMEQNETIRTIAENMIAMLEVATFNNNKGIENDG